MRNFLRCLMAATLFVSSLSGEAEQFTLKQNMSAHDQQSIGLQNLTTVEQRALEKWLDLWTKKVVNQVLLMGCECDTSDCLHAIYNRIAPENFRKSYTPSPSWGTPYAPETSSPAVPQSGRPSGPSSQLPTSAQQPWGAETTKLMAPDRLKAPATLGQPTLIAELIQKGALIKLNDGSTWQVVPTDVHITSSWAPFDQVQLSQSSLPGRYQLIDLTQNQRAEVMQPGSSPSPSNPVQRDKQLAPINYFVEKNLNQGQAIVLQNGLLFTVRVGDAFRISRHWQPGTALQVSRVGGGYPYSLRNVQTGEIVQAQLQP